jgi:hypothetical protein
MAGQVGKGRVVEAAVEVVARGAAQRWPQARRPTKACAAEKMRRPGLQGHLLLTHSADLAWWQELMARLAQEDLVAAQVYVATR